MKHARSYDTIVKPASNRNEETEPYYLKFMHYKPRVGRFIFSGVILPPNHMTSSNLFRVLQQ